MTIFDEIRRDGLYERLVFIVGNARSGTSIIANILNMSEKVFLLEEANFFIHLTKTHFPIWFNGFHRDTGTPPRKGTYVSPFDGEGETGLTTLHRLAMDYEIVGDKIAFGPHGRHDGRSQQEYCFTEHTKWYTGCRHILTSRNPYESLLSMHMMFPHESLRELLWCWLESLRYTCIFYTWFPRCRLVFLENIGPETFNALNEFLVLGLAAPKEFFDDRLRQTSMPAAREFALAHKAEVGSALDAADFLYQELRGMFSPVTLCYSGPEQIFGLIGALVWRIEEIQATVISAGAAAIPNAPCPGISSS